MTFYRRLWAIKKNPVAVKFTRQHKWGCFSAAAQRCEGDAALLKELSEKSGASSRNIQYRRQNTESGAHPFLDDRDPGFSCTRRYGKATVGRVCAHGEHCYCYCCCHWMYEHCVCFRPPKPRDTNALRSVEHGSSKRVTYCFTYSPCIALWSTQAGTLVRLKETKKQMGSAPICYIRL